MARKKPSYIGRTILVSFLGLIILAVVLFVGSDVSQNLSAGTLAQQAPGASATPAPPTGACYHYSLSTCAQTRAAECRRIRSIDSGWPNIVVDTCYKPNEACIEEEFGNPIILADNEVRLQFPEGENAQFLCTDDHLGSSGDSNVKETPQWDECWATVKQKAQADCPHGYEPICSGAQFRYLQTYESQTGCYLRCEGYYTCNPRPAAPTTSPSA